MRKYEVKIKKESSNYPIFIDRNLIGKTASLFNLGAYSKIAVITDVNIKPLWLNKLQDALGRESLSIVLPSGEKEKSIKQVEKIWGTLLKNHFDRKSLIINLGGGVVGDMGGFAASTFMRGIDFLQAPTTLLSQVDASVGGKVGINFGGGKNLIGAFSQPVCVIIDVDTLSTLPKRELLSGFGEVIKHGLIRDKEYFEFVTSKAPTDFTEDELIKVIEGSCRIKAKVVEEDEEEAGLRKILNFGHTIGHAIETLSLGTKSPLLHGEAVAIGMVGEAKISCLKAIMSKGDLDRVEAAIANAGLPTRFDSDVSVEDVLGKIQLDKKNVGGETRWVLLKRLGEAVYDVSVAEELVVEAIKYVLK